MYFLNDLKLFSDRKNKKLFELKSYNYLNSDIINLTYIASLKSKYKYSE